MNVSSPRLKISSRSRLAPVLRSGHCLPPCQTLRSRSSRSPGVTRSSAYSPSTRGTGLSVARCTCSSACRKSTARGEDTASGYVSSTTRELQTIARLWAPRQPVSEEERETCPIDGSNRRWRTSLRVLRSRNASADAMNCPRCDSRSVLRSHATISCLSCGHVVSEPAREVWDPVSTVPGGSHRSPPVTAAELASWQSDLRLTPAIPA